MHIIGLPAKRDGSGGGPTAFKRTVSTTTAPHGPKVAAVESMRKREALRRKHLSAEEYQEWKEYRQLIRNLLADLDYDPSAHAPLKTQGDGKNRWKASALWRYAGGYLAEPWLDNYRQVTNEEIQDIMDDPVFHLSDKDKDRHRVIVGKRKKKSRW